ncbi:hypothetical protein [Candidatus Villigracilis saccharophilus]|uniref:hypothetical protein n=1 Tax=Candidatus Villigracilis saccharophilus TaxID=3140684 RepID=UPI00313473C7|nr:hypothetical protein [Anaerolineales bacterium]
MHEPIKEDAVPTRSNSAKVHTKQALKYLSCPRRNNSQSPSHHRQRGHSGVLDWGWVNFGELHAL